MFPFHIWDSIYFRSLFLPSCSLLASSSIKGSLKGEALQNLSFPLSFEGEGDTGGEVTILYKPHLLLDFFDCFSGNHTGALGTVIQDFVYVFWLGG